MTSISIGGKRSVAAGNMARHLPHGTDGAVALQGHGHANLFRDSVGNS
jgi:hypothetical protein